MDTSRLSDAVDDYLATERSELFEFTERLVGFETQNPPGGTVDVVKWLESTLGDIDLELDRVAVDPEKPNLLAGESAVTRIDVDPVSGLECRARA
ncbi:acetylornithine deacetylase/succinyl-diaminopimelate desuccinylase [Halosimplex carlsbadense 2-9-1]|uniref:Acetylornithine deacetylase/succinyl-diaminopimelate desuccinylase n=2 Tax=Halosimplex carlsbadense TaxID=171164 RepID=M0CFI2_9EURY|nr:acetylornithine deacetylase/succinyl-diaminopimelate desuccinylase [Halosimplex carlsbadense 2-9-1]